MTESAAASLGKYEIVGRLARGQTTDLLLARTRGMAGFERYVALKCVRPERIGDAVFVHAFINEARLAASLHHHNIVQVQDIGDEGGVPYFAMEYIQGEDLRAVLAKLHEAKEQMPLQHLVTLGTSVAAALHHAHEQRGPDGKSLGIIHRDVSPGNIIVGYDGNVKVVDFSMAKATITTVTSVGVVRGKAGYMAPEQCAGERLDRRSDVFALGIVLYEMATVSRLFKGNTDHETMSTIVLGTIPRPRTVRTEVPARLEEIIMKALARLPADRYQTAAELGAALEKFAVEAGVTASTTALAGFVKEKFGDPKDPRAGVQTRDARAEFDGDGAGVAEPAGSRPRKIPSVARAMSTEVETEPPTTVGERAFESETPTVTAVDDEGAPKRQMNPGSIAGKLAKAGLGNEGPTVKADRADIEKALAAKEAEQDKPVATKLPLPARPTPAPGKLEKAAEALRKDKDLTPLPRKDATPSPKKKDVTPLPTHTSLERAVAAEPMVDPSAETPIVEDAQRAPTNDDVSTVKMPKTAKAPQSTAKLPPPALKSAARAAREHEATPATPAEAAAAAAAVEPADSADAKPEEINRGDMTELVSPLPPLARGKTVAPPKAIALAQKYRWWLAGAAGLVVVVGITAVIATSGSSDLAPAAKPDETAAPTPTPVAEPTPAPTPAPTPVAETPPAPEPTPEVKPEPTPVAETPPAPEPKPEPKPVAKPEPTPKPEHVAEVTKPKANPTPTPTPTHPKQVAKKTPPKQPPKKKQASSEYDPDSLFFKPK